MDSKKMQIERAWEQAFGNIFQPYVAPTGERSERPEKLVQSSSHDIRRHLARTAAQRGLTSLNPHLQDEYWGKDPY
ncbi:MAG TPA: hypothetical protein VJQ78_11330 [Sphingobium sp.]|nr:hypothetical protein [Sphingobium sp.]